MARNQTLNRIAMAQPPQPQPAQPVSRIKPSLEQMMKDPKYGRAKDIMSLPAPKLVALLKDPDATVYARAKACQRLAVIGDKTAVPALAPLLTDPQLSHYARTALETNPDPSASDALRAALGKVKGLQLVGVINSLGKRRDKRAIRQLEELRHHEDLEVCRAADSALALIRPLL